MYFLLFLKLVIHSRTEPTKRMIIHFVANLASMFDIVLFEFVSFKDEIT